MSEEDKSLLICIAGAIASLVIGVFGIFATGGYAVFVFCSVSSVFAVAFGLILGRRTPNLRLKDERTYLRGCLFLSVVCISLFASSCVIPIVSGPSSLFGLLWILGFVTILIGIYWVAQWRRSYRISELPTLAIPDNDRVFIAYGYDYKTKSYRIWMSPIINLPPTQEYMDAYLSAEEVISGEYTSREESIPAVERAMKKLKVAGWRVSRVRPPVLFKNIPYWVGGAGGEMGDRDYDKDLKYWEERDHIHTPLREDLRERKRLEDIEEQRQDLERQRRDREREQKAREDSEFRKVAEPHPDWVLGADDGQPVNRNSVKPSDIESSPMVWHLDIDEIVISWGYDYQTNCFKIWTSPIITQPSTQAHLEAYSSTKRVASRRYADRQRCVSAARRAIAKLNSAGWRVIQVSPPILLENLPRWVSESGGEMSDRDPIKDRQNWSKGL